MNLSQATQDIIGATLITRRDYCQEQLERSCEVLEGAEAAEDEAYWRAERDKVIAALREWFDRERS